MGEKANLYALTALSWALEGPAAGAPLLSKCGPRLACKEWIKGI